MHHLETNLNPKCSKFNSRPYSLIQTVLLIADSTATYSASVVEVVTFDCSLLLQEIGPPPKNVTQPLVDLRVFKSPAKSESEKVVHPPCLSELRWIPRSSVPLRYLRILLRICKSNNVGFVTFRLIKPTGYAMSGLV